MSLNNTRSRRTPTAAALFPLLLIFLSLLWAPVHHCPTSQRLWRFKVPQRSRLEQLWSFCGLCLSLPMSHLSHPCCSVCPSFSRSCLCAYAKFVYLLISGCTSCFHLLIIANTIMSLIVWLSLWDTVFNSLGRMYKNGMVGTDVNFIFLKEYKGSSFSSSSPTLGIFS